MSESFLTAGLRAALAERLERSEGAAVETICLASLALRHNAGPEVKNALRVLLGSQNGDGSWAPLLADEGDGCWTTALAVLVLVALGAAPERLRYAIRWLLEARGREANWFWRWKFKIIDTNVKFDPSKYGWSWVPGTVSWVIPTAFSVIALRQTQNRGMCRCSELTERVVLGTNLLFDLMCPGGGWNAGNGVAFGVPCAPYIDATATALLALRGRENDPGTQDSLMWLANHLLPCPSPYSLAWGIIALAAYHQQYVADDLLNRAAARLTSLVEQKWPADISTLAACALALDAVDGDNVFEV